MKVFDYETRARLQRMRNHMAMDKLAKIERGRYGWTIAREARPMTKCPHCLSELDAAKGKPRSLEQLRRFFGVLRAMKFHWPETAEFQPESEEHLRKWVLVKSGHRETTDIPVPFAEDEPGVTRLAALSIEGAVKAAGAFAFIRPHPDGGLVRVFKAKSIAFDKLGQAEFNKLNDEVEAVYKAETGLDADEVLKQTEKAA